ncbi:biotin--[acetyl-CoA-carboxylase] ligase [Lacticaseibacillus porcinae]|uniref:biotin--[acetyl-CoA-carboxylase] ligase n=1 Tax=Lacticaseibacillus porcinae TaxID=1123687 RepID=UPI000F772998|nr:biotin--[acetyl-CoA-carboxylase] ligase [Lacticaseibacillus porcinae]
MNTKQRVLTALLANGNEWHSGDSLASELGLSRESVWKAINALRKAGHEIIARKSQGYRYVGCSHLDEMVIAYHLQNALPLTVENVVTSTQDVAKSWLAAQTTVTTAAFVADRQTHGYGRRGRGFYSPAESGLYLSLVIPNPQADLTQVGLLTTGVATAVVAVLQDFFPNADFGLKWVNDVMLNHKKVAGILCEAVLALESATSAAFVIGVGLNLDTASFPDDLANVAGAISDQAIDRNALAAKLISAIVERASDYQTAAFLPEYRRLSTVVGHSVTVKLGEQQLTGKVVDIADNGGLELLTDQGVQTITAGEVVKVSVDE